MDLSVLWFILIAVLWTGYVVLEGFDFGVGMLIKWLPKSEKERRVMLNSIGPHWDGNEVWLLTAGGATFAAFPEWYATMFSGMYVALFLILVALILRIVALEWRGKISDAKWRNRWDNAHLFGAWVPAVLWGVAFGNLVQGMKIEVIGADGALVPAADVAGALATSSHQLTGGFFSLVTPYTLLGGVVTALLFLSNGLLFLSLKTSGELQLRASQAALPASLAATAVAAIFVVWGQLAYSANVFGWIPLVVAALLLVATVVSVKVGKFGIAFTTNALAGAGAVAWIFSTMFPYVMKSSIDPAYSLSIAQASSSAYTLGVMTVVALTLVPIVLGYVAWTYWVFRKRISIDHMPDDPAGLTLEMAETKG